MFSRLRSKLILLLSVVKVLTPVSAMDRQVCYNVGPTFSDLTGDSRDVDAAVVDFCKKTTATYGLASWEQWAAFFPYDNNLWLYMFIANLGDRYQPVSNDDCLRYYRNRTATCPNGGKTAVLQDTEDMWFYIMPYRGPPGGAEEEEMLSLKNAWMAGKKSLKGMV